MPGDIECGSIKKIFINEYHYQKLTNNLSTGKTGYHSMNAVVPMEDITYAIDILDMATPAVQGHIEQFTEKSSN